MGFAESVRTCFRRYATFSGRASRSEFWWWVLFVVGMSVVLGLADRMLFGADPVTGRAPRRLSGVFNLLVLLPWLAVAFRRMHDSGRPGWYYFAPLLVSVGLMFVLLSGIVIATATDVDPTGVSLLVGGVGAAATMVIHLCMVVLMIWWLTRPSDPGENRYGPPPVPR
ncbi:DUF805 domain-containing protein [Salipiger sp.]|uniref:DUF805 domain-containing protein n=1 Tax=Salipiger sp. TaxID=2078585 RepID=UPI003A98024D